MSSMSPSALFLHPQKQPLFLLCRQAKYGGRRAALDAREECYAKIERVEKEKWALRDSLVSEEREVCPANVRVNVRVKVGVSGIQ